jgi:hypothetical protein
LLEEKVKMKVARSGRDQFPAGLSWLLPELVRGKSVECTRDRRGLHNMTAKLVVLLTKSEVTQGMIDALGMFKSLYRRTLFPLPNSGGQERPAGSWSLPGFKA